MQYEKLDPDFKQKWVKALRSGEYKQGNGNLYKSDENCFCCLGVACLIAGESLDALDFEELISPELFQNNNIPEYLKCDYLEKDSPVRKLVDMNDGANEFKDNKQSFEQIADWIDTHL